MDRTLREAIEKYGTKNQIYVAIEELSELQKELCKTLRYYDVNNMVESDIFPTLSEEMADVHIILNSLAKIFNNGQAVLREVEVKIDRLDRMIHD